MLKLRMMMTMMLQTPLAKGLLLLLMSNLDIIYSTYFNVYIAVQIHKSSQACAFFKNAVLR